MESVAGDSSLVPKRQSPKNAYKGVSLHYAAESCNPALNPGFHEGILGYVYAGTRVYTYTKWLYKTDRPLRKIGAGDLLAGETGLEPATPGFGDRCSAS